VAPRDARLFMLADKRWKYVAPIGFRPMLYDLQSDPNEFRDLGDDPSLQDQRARLAAALSHWALRLAQRTTRSVDELRARLGKSERRGILIGVWDESELPEELWSGYLGEEGRSRSS